MRKGTVYTGVEKGTILGLREAGWTFVAIGKHLGRSGNKGWRIVEWSESGSSIECIGNSPKVGKGHDPHTDRLELWCSSGSEDTKKGAGGAPW
ncbi:hypothetical protein F443_08383 [Phytophthora nicotianae P1569]|uniref:Uncharacterized protein n=2 Tax=Phytophthora nicotianae TaxID=4792 RepID=V9F9F1_PHYNI|nr:hypothetical protein F443_08383 [Phytophthora nicotianae P1569]ETO76097.1 hypothetical protein F444_08442 [Phytophthora nicotianae P1976]